ncbi:hypothetical protein IGB42_01966 [Andreprevotia sp. IGB-42]|nr:hypothetical protein IGB42_01966 [Andreprevotia sp. IGB-42]
MRSHPFSQASDHYGTDVTDGLSVIAASTVADPASIDAQRNLLAQQQARQQQTIADNTDAALMLAASQQHDTETAGIARPGQAPSATSMPDLDETTLLQQPAGGPAAPDIAQQASSAPLILSQADKPSRDERVADVHAQAKGLIERHPLMSLDDGFALQQRAPAVIAAKAEQDRVLPENAPQPGIAPVKHGQQAAEQPHAVVVNPAAKRSDTRPAGKSVATAGAGQLAGNAGKPLIMLSASNTPFTALARAQLYAATRGLSATYTPVAAAHGYVLMRRDVLDPGAAMLERSDLAALPRTAAQEGAASDKMEAFSGVVERAEHGEEGAAGHVSNSAVPNALLAQADQPLLLTYTPTTNTLAQIRNMPFPQRWQAGEQYVQELYGSAGPQHFDVPAGTFSGENITGAGSRFVGAPVPTTNGGVLANEVKTYPQ